MSLLQNKWILPDSSLTQVNSDLNNYSPIFQQILYNRGFADPGAAKTFLYPNDHFVQPSDNLIDLPKAVRIVQSAFEQNLSLGIFGDYDADGITSTALLTDFFQNLGFTVFPYIPDRFSEGYGLSKTGLDYLSRKGAGLLITVDTGISNLELIDYAKSLGMTVILTDHHLPGSKLPNADAVINPNRPDDPFPDKNLAGVGVAYKFVEALSAVFDAHLENYLDLVAVGTIADVVPLQGVNRSLTSRGLKLLNSTPRQGLYSLIGAAGLTAGTLKASDVAFQIGPRLNSAGRLEHASQALQLLLSRDHQLAGELALELDSINARRKMTTSKVLEHPLIASLLKSGSPPDILLAFSEEFHPGVVGIAAGKLSSKLYRPAVIGSIVDQIVTASCRSIPGLDIFRILSQVSDLFLEFGGHSAAAGFSLPKDSLPEFKSRVESAVSSEISSKTLIPEIEIDAQVSLADLNQELISELNLLEPTGADNPPAVFLTRDLRVTQIRRMGSHKNHLKLTVSQGDSSLQAVAFGFGDRYSSIPDRIDLVYYFEENYYRGNRSNQLRVLDLQESNQPHI